MFHTEFRMIIIDILWFVDIRRKVKYRFRATAILVFYVAQKKCRNKVTCVQNLLLEYFRTIPSPRRIVHPIAQRYTDWAITALKDNKRQII
jgi:hypothetical protein